MNVQGALFAMLASLLFKKCQGKRLITFVSGSGCGAIREITNHKVNSGQVPLSSIPCSNIIEEREEFRRKFKANLRSNGSSSKQGAPQDINVGWSVWSEWSSCSDEIGIRERARTCGHPPPNSTDLDCIGMAEELLLCPEHALTLLHYNTNQGFKNDSSDQQIAVNARQCHTMCRESDGDRCIAWTWKTTGTCSFYHSDPGQLIAEPGSTSGGGPLSCSQDGVSYVGGNLKQVGDVRFAEECLGLCREEVGCAYYTYDKPGNGLCYLKADYVKTAGYPLRTSGSLICHH